MMRKLWALALTKFLCNLNDNAFKTIAMLLAVQQVRDPGTQAALVSLAAMIFMMPFVLFPTVAGWLADRACKRRVLIACKVAELVFAALGAVCLAMTGQWGFAPVLSVVFLLAAQASFLAPAFQGLLPEIFDERELSAANGITELVAFLGIILGCGVGGFVAAKLPPGSWGLGVPCILLGVVGVAAVFFVPRGAAPYSREPLGWQLLTGYCRDFRFAWQTRELFLCILGYAVFMSVGALLMSSLVAFGSQELRLSPDRIAVLQVVAALGIGFGCFVAGKFSGDRIEFGLAPIGALGMTVFLLHLAFTHTFLFALLNTAALGFFGGFFELPLIVYIQERAPAATRGKTLATANAVCFWGMFIVSALMLGLTGGLSGDLPADADLFTRVRANFLNLSFRQLYLAGGVAMLLSTVYAFYLLPDALFRMLMVLATRFVYRVEVREAGRLPRRGAALLLANHVSWVDAFLVAAASPRAVHFVVEQELCQRWWLRPWRRWALLVPLPPASQPKAFQAALERLQGLLRAGEVVCVFPEGERTADGNVGPFRPGYARMLPPTGDVPLLPVGLAKVWGSIFSRHGMARASWPRPVVVAFGAPLAPCQSPEEARQVVAAMVAAIHAAPAPGSEQTR